MKISERFKKGLSQLRDEVRRYFRPPTYAHEMLKEESEHKSSKRSTDEGEIEVTHRDHFGDWDWEKACHRNKSPPLPDTRSNDVNVLLTCDTAVPPPRIECEGQTCNWHDCQAIQGSTKDPYGISTPRNPDLRRNNVDVRRVAKTMRQLELAERESNNDGDEINHIDRSRDNDTGCMLSTGQSTGSIAAQSTYQMTPIGESMRKPGLHGYSSTGIGSHSISGLHPSQNEDVVNDFVLNRPLGTDSAVSLGACSLAYDDTDTVLRHNEKNDDVSD